MMDRAEMAAIVRRAKAHGGVIHLTVAGGLCAHASRGDPGHHRVPSAEANQDDADWLIALVGSLWPEGMPECPHSKAGDVEA